jgi:hypothetical protein
MPPEPTVEGAVSTDTTLSFRRIEGAARYIVRWRRTDSSQWERSLAVSVKSVPLGVGCFPPPVVDRPARTPEDVTCEVVLPHVRVDDWVFGVSSVSADGYESPVASAVPGGAFRPWTPPPVAPTGQ